MALQIQEEEIKEQQNEPVNVGGVIINSSKAPRLPRWTRQEILVLIQGKRVAEKRVRRGRTAALTNGGSVEPKWATVSSYCKRHGVNRGPVQCRKRWSNLAGDFKKIKEWESQSNIKDGGGGESFWVMRNDLRRERKLPGFFDKEVYDILDGSAPLNSSVDDDDDNNGNINNNNSIINKEHEIEVNDDDGYGNDENESEAAVAGGGAAAVVLFDSGRSAAADDGLFSDFEQSHSVQDEEDQNRTPDHHNKDAPSGIPMSIPAPTPISEKQYEPFTGGGGTAPGNNEKQPAGNPEMGSTSQEGRKRRRFFTEDDAEADEDDRDRERDSLHNQLVNVLERNGRILTAQLEAHNINLKLDREERKDHANSLVAVLNKLADALGRIADKL